MTRSPTSPLLTVALVTGLAVAPLALPRTALAGDQAAANTAIVPTKVPAAPTALPPAQPTPVKVISTPAPTGVVDPSHGTKDTPAGEGPVAPPKTSGDIAEVIVTAPNYGSREEADEFHRQEFARLDKIYGRKEAKQTRVDALSHTNELDTGTMRDPTGANALERITNGN